MTEPRRISYGTDDPTARYTEGIVRAKNPTALRHFLAEWPTLAPDARVAATGIKSADWPEWRRGLEAERQGVFAGESWAERYGPILVPARMLRTSLVAERFMVPWGVAWIRLRETGMLDSGSETP